MHLRSEAILPLLIRLHETHSCYTIFIRNSCTKCHLNSTNGVVVNTNWDIDGRTWSPQGVFYRTPKALIEVVLEYDSFNVLLRKLVD